MVRKIALNRIKDGREKYRRALAQASIPAIEKTRDNKHSQAVLRSKIQSLIFDEPQQILPSEQRSPSEEALLKLLNGFLEIAHTFDIMDDIPIYLQKPFPRGRNLSKLRFIKYHVTNYFNEIYILRERLKAYHTIVVRISKKFQQEPNPSAAKRANEIIAAFDNLVNVRGEHVHRQRYTDDDFDRLDFFEMFSLEESKAFIEELNRRALKSKAKWVTLLKSSNTSIRQLLSAYFHEIFKLTFDKKGEWVGSTKKTSA